MSHLNKIVNLNLHPINRSDEYLSVCRNKLISNSEYSQKYTNYRKRLDNFFYINLVLSVSLNHNKSFLVQILFQKF